MEPEFARAVGSVRPTARVAVIREGGDGSGHGVAYRDGYGGADGQGYGEPVGFFPYETGPLGQGRAIGSGASDAQGAVCRAGLRLPAPELLKACSLSAWEFDNLEAGQELFVPSAAEEFESPVIDVREGYEAYAAGLRARSPKFFRTTAAKERRLGRQAGAVRFVFDERDPAALRTLMEWKSAQYRRTGRRDRFAKEWISALVRQLARTRTPGCSGVLSVLYAAERAPDGMRACTHTPGRGAHASASPARRTDHVPSARHVLSAHQEPYGSPLPRAQCVPYRTPRQWGAGQRRAGSRAGAGATPPASGPL